MTMAASNRMTTARHFITDAVAPDHLCTQSRFEFALDAAYIAALEVAVQQGFVLRPLDEDDHPLEGAVRAALVVLPMSAQDKALWPRYMHYLRRRYIAPHQADPAPLEHILAWSERAIEAAERWFAARQ